MSIKDSHKLKQLQSRKAKLEVDKQQLQEERRQIDKKHSSVSDQLKKVNKEIEDITSSDSITVTEHAIIRYVERCMGLDIKQIESQILSDGVISQIKALGNGKIPIGNGYRAVVKDKTVISIVEG